MKGDLVLGVVVKLMEHFLTLHHHGSIQLDISAEKATRHFVVSVLKAGAFGRTTFLIIASRGGVSHF